MLGMFCVRTHAGHAAHRAHLPASSRRGTTRGRVRTQKLAASTTRTAQSVEVGDLVRSTVPAGTRAHPRCCDALSRWRGLTRRRSKTFHSKISTTTKPLPQAHGVVPACKDSDRASIVPDVLFPPRCRELLLRHLRAAATFLLPAYAHSRLEGVAPW